MDPEVIAQLEAQLIELTEMLARQTSMMGGQMDAMGRVSSSANKASDAIKTNSATSTTSITKYAEAQEKAAMATGKSEIASKALAATFGVLSASVSGLIGTIGALSGSLLSTEQGMAKYGKVADAAAGAAEGLARSIPLVGGALGGLVGTLGKIAAQVLTDGLKLIDTFVNLRDGLTEIGGVLPVTGEQLIKLANNAGYYGERMQVLGKITQGLGTSLASLDQTAGRGATKFMELAAVTDDMRRQYGRMGISQERLTEMQGLYVKSQQASGLSMQLQTKTAAQLQKESLAYVDNMSRLSALTGKQAEQLQAEQDQVAAVAQERLQIIRENAEIKQLRSQGREAEARNIERQQQDRAKFRQELVAAVGPQEATQIMKVIRSGVYDNVSAPLANLGVDIAGYSEKLKKGGIDAAEAARGLAMDLDSGRERMGTSLGAAGEFLSEEQMAQLGLGNEAMGRQLDRAGKNLEAASDQAEKDIADKKKQGDDLADMVENVRSQERQFQALYQEFLLDKVMKLSNLLKDFDLFGLVTKDFSKVISGLTDKLGMLAAVVGGGLAAAAVLAARSLRGVIGGVGGFLKGLGGLIGRGVVGAVVGYGVDAIAGAFGVGKNLDPKIQSQDDANWERASFGEKLQSMPARGIEKLGRLFFMDNIANQGQAERVKSETEYLSKKYGPQAAGTSASPMMVEMAKPMEIDKASIDQMGITEADMTKAMRTGTLDANTALVASIEDTKKQLKESLDKSQGESTKKQEEQSKAAEKAQQYTIKHGDTLSELAKKFGTTVEALLEANKNIKNKDLIHAGAGLNIPGMGVNQYTVKKGDTLKAIAKQLGISEEEITKANPELLKTIKSGGWKSGLKLNLPGMPPETTSPTEMLTEQMDETQDALDARNRETTALVEQQQSATDSLLGSTGTYGNTLKETNKSLALFKDLLEALNRVLSPSAAAAGQATVLGGGAVGAGAGAAPTMTGGTDPSFGSSTTSSTNATTPGAPGAMPSMPNFSGSMMGAGMMPGLLGMPNGMMGMPPTGFDGNMGRILATIRARESRGDYQLPGPKGMPGTASGAYAFIDSSWRALTKKYGVGTEYARAFMAPPAIQDQVAARYVQEILQKAGGDVSKVPIAWYTGNINGTMSSKALAINGGLTPQAYQQKWMATYMGQSDSTMASSGGMPMMGMPMMGGMMGGMQGDGGLISNLAMMSNMMGMMGGGMMGPGMMGGPMMNPYFGGQGSFPPDQSIVNLGKMLQAQGLRVSENPAFGGVNPVHKGRGHYEGRAIDVNVGVGSKEAYDPVNGARFDQLAAQLRQAGYTVVWRAPGHYDHMHVETKSKGARLPMAEKGGVFKGPDSGYLAMLHGKEAVVPLDTPSMRGNKIGDLMTSLTKTGVKEGGIGKINKINDAVSQIVNVETTKAIKAVSEANAPLQMISNEIGNSMRKVMTAHNQTMNELTYKLSEMIDALNTSNDVTKKILKKAST